MIVFKYTKCDNAQYISHLDTLHHLNKILRRANVPMEYSKGYNPHMQVYMSAPMPLGVKSKCEYCLIESDMSADLFMQKFNQYSIKGMKCEFAINCKSRINVAGLINRCQYEIYGINKFNVDEILKSDEFIVVDKRGVQKNVRDKIYNLFFEGNVLYATLGFGNETLRIDHFTNSLIEKYGGECVDYKKRIAYNGEIEFDNFLNKENKTQNS